MMNPVKQTGLSKTATYGIFIIVNVLEKLVKPLVRRAPAGAFRYFRRYYGQNHLRHTMSCWIKKEGDWT